MGGVVGALLTGVFCAVSHGVRAAGRVRARPCLLHHLLPNPLEAFEVLPGVGGVVEVDP